MTDIDQLISDTKQHYMDGLISYKEMNARLKELEARKTMSAFAKDLPEIK